MKRINLLSRTAKILAASLMAGAVLTACSSNGGNGEQPSPSSTDGSSKGVKLTLWMSMNSNATPVVKSLGELPMVKEWEKRTNVGFQFQHPTGSTAADVNQQFGVMLASGKLPDLIFNYWNGVPGGVVKMYEDGAIIKLNDLIDQHAPNLKKLLDDHPEVLKQIKADNGDIYVMPSLRVGEHGTYRTFSGPIIRQDWLDELGLQQPQTIAEWETVLRTIKEKKGIAPYVAHKDLLIGGPSARDFSGAFNVGDNFYVDNGIIKYGPLQPEFQDYLRTMQSWYKEGLIDPDYATNDGKAMDAKITSGKAAAFYGYIGSSIGTYSTALEKSDPKAVLAALQYPVAKKGDEPKFIPANWEFAGVGLVLTTANKHPEETVKALDYLYSEEGALLKNFGIEGTTYTMKDGNPVYTDLILHNPDGLPVSQAMAKNFIANYPFVGTDDDRYNDQYYVYPTQKEAAKTFSKFAKNAYSVLMPPISLTVDEASESGKIMTDINTYREETVTKIVMGTQSADSFPDAVAQMKKMGIERALEIQQAAYDRFIARK